MGMPISVMPNTCSATSGPVPPEVGIFTACQGVLPRGLADFEGERAEVHEVRHVGVHTRGGDHRAPVGVPDEHRVALDGIERAAHIVGVVVERCIVVRHRRQIDDQQGTLGGVEQRHHSLPAPRAVPSAVNEDDGSLHQRILAEPARPYRPARVP